MWNGEEEKKQTKELRTNIDWREFGVSVRYTLPPSVQKKDIESYTHSRGKKKMSQRQVMSLTAAPRLMVLLMALFSAVLAAPPSLTAVPLGNTMDYILLAFLKYV